MVYFTLKLFIFLIFKLELIKLSTIDEFLNDINMYMNEICSHNGVPKVDKKTNKVICTCEEKYANEPREQYKKYINGQFVQCSYRRKRRFFTFFLAGICPFGMDYFYLGHYWPFFLILIYCLIILTFNIVTIILNYKINKKNEEIKRQNKLKKINKKFNIQNIAEINDRCVNLFTKATRVLTYILIIFWMNNFIIQGLGYIKDSYGIETENDMGYIFEIPKD